MKLPTLYGKTSKDSVKVWTISTEGADIVTVFGQLDGKMQTSRKTAKGKNIGKANETSPEAQAALEATSTWKNKKDKGYTETLDNARDEVFLPMLAKDFEDNKKHVKYPCYVQPKLDGVRCMAYWNNDEVILMSRLGKTYDVPHIKEELERILPKEQVLDGELYVHGLNFQEITRLVKKNRPESIQLQYHVYDGFIKNDMMVPYNQRHCGLLRILKDAKHAQVVRNSIATNEAHVMEDQGNFVVEGYEGAMVRNSDMHYRLKHRSSDLLKVKTFKDDEFLVVGHDVGEGRFSETPIWICETKDKRQFRVTPKGTMAERKQALSEASEYIGQWLKVKYFELSEDGIPRFPVGLGLRLPEDM